ncbi:MAG TPA: M67 family metallopeptidase [Acidimicrobiales bacterium]
MASAPTSILVISRQLRDEMTAHCLRELPFEGCGLLIGHSEGGHVLRVVPTRNSAASSRLYAVDSLDFLRADRAAEEAGLDVIGVFHSHTHTDPYPSPTDVAQAPDPSWHYAIVSLRHQAPSIRSYRIEQGEVVEEQVLDHA